METPAHLKSYALVKGTLKTAPLDAPGRFEGVVTSLQGAGWIVSVKSIGTDFAGPLGMPVPRDQPLEVYLKRKDGAFTAKDAERALTQVLESMDLHYSPIGAWLQ